MKFLMNTAIAALALASSGAAQAATNLISNGSFEVLPPDGLQSCGVGCFVSNGKDIPSWVNTPRNDTPQFQPGSSSGNFTFFNYVPDGLTTAVANGGTISQTASLLAITGTLYTLSVDFGRRNDGVYNPNASAELGFASNTVFATGIAPTPGNWSTYRVSYLATAADAGQSISVVLRSTAFGGNWDNVRLFASVPTAGIPEPASWALMIAGFGLVGGGLRRRVAKLTYA
jgi:hypothetical protein